MELCSVHSYLGMLIQHCLPYWFYPFLQFSCWTLSSLRSGGNILITFLASISQNIYFRLPMSVTHIGHSLRYFMRKMWLTIRWFSFDARFWGLKYSTYNISSKPHIVGFEFWLLCFVQCDPRQGSSFTQTELPCVMRLLHNIYLVG